MVGWRRGRLLREDPRPRPLIRRSAPISPTCPKGARAAPATPGARPDPRAGGLRSGFATTSGLHRRRDPPTPSWYRGMCDRLRSWLRVIFAACRGCSDPLALVSSRLPRANAILPLVGSMGPETSHIGFDGADQERHRDLHDLLGEKVSRLHVHAARDHRARRPANGLIGPRGLDGDLPPRRARRGFSSLCGRLWWRLLDITYAFAATDSGRGWAPEP